jgi:tol-pal system protein YbgF
MKCSALGLIIARATASTAVLAAVFGCGVAIAAVPVEDSLFRAAAQLDTQSVATQTRDSQINENVEDQGLWAPAAQDTATSLASSMTGDQPLFYQIQVLQQEVRQLRGLLEEQAYLIQKLQQNQRLQYVDLDRRVAALVPNRPAPGPTPVPAEDSLPESGQQGLKSEPVVLPSVSASEPVVQNEPVPTTEREAYAQAIGWMRAKRFEESTGAFEQLIVDYPNGQYTPNAFYWLGELHLATGSVEPARQNFVQVIRLYPDHQKVPDALYKLGVLYFQLGDEGESKRYLTQVQTEFPQSSAGALAKRYLAEME